jgi:hypothetical protein
MAPSTVKRLGENKTLPVRSRLGGSSGEAIRRTPEPEKTDGLCEDSLGLGTAKAVIAPKAVTVHASMLLAPSQE